MSERSLVVAGIAVMVLVWGTTWAVIRIGLEGIPPFAGVALRFAIAGAILYGLIRALGVPQQRSPRLTRIWLVECGFSLCLSYGIVYWAEQSISSGLASIIFSTMPLFVALMAHRWLADEPLRLTQSLGVALGLFGVVVIFSDDLVLAAKTAVLLPATVMLVSPIAAAFGHVYIKKHGSGIHPLNVVAVPMLATGVVMAIVSLIFESNRDFRLDAPAIGAVLYLAVMGSALTFTIYYWVLERVAATRLALITLAIPVVAVVVGTLFLNEPFSLRTALGAVLVLAGVAVASRG